MAVDCEPLPAVVDVLEARGSGAVVHEAAPDNMRLSRRFAGGDVEAALAAAAVVVVERAFRTNRQTVPPHRSLSPEPGEGGGRFLPRPPQWQIP